MKRYDTYTESGISWIGKVPSHWEVVKGKRIYEKCDGGVWGEEPTGTDADTPVLRSTEQGIDGSLCVKEPAFRFLSKVEKERGLLHLGDLIITKSSGSPDHIGKTSIIDKHTASLGCCFSNFIQRIRVKGNDLYYWYAFNSPLVRLQFQFLSSTTTGLGNLSATIIKEVLLPVPPQEEQEAIVAYLDEKCAQIDRYVASLEERIERLGELRQALIAEAVTRGINPQAPLRPSGIPWLGKTPQHWEMRKLRQLIELFSDKGHPNEKLLSVVRELGVVVRNVDSKEENHNYIPDDLSGYKRIRKGDFAINKMKAWQGSYAVSGHQGIVSPAYYTCHLRLKNKEFFNMAIRSQAYVPFFTQNSKGIRVGQWDLSPVGLKEIPFFLPPQEEQEAIVAYLDEKTTQIDRYTGQLEEMIRQIKDLRQTIISEAVTGKICVLPN